MAPKLPQSLEETISAYRNKYLVDLEGENDDLEAGDNTDAWPRQVHGQRRQAPAETPVRSSRSLKRKRDVDTEDTVDDDDDGDGGGSDDDHDDHDNEESKDESGSSSEAESDSPMDAECAADDSDIEESDGLRLRRMRPRGRAVGGSRLPRDLAGLMGQANVSFARQEFNDGIVMCQEVIRLAPRCPDPFISLAEYYEAHDEEKAEQLYLIAAYLQPSNTHLWVQVAESATKRREFRLAATCYTKAIRAEKNESNAVSYHLRRCNLYEKLGDQKKALKGYEHLIAALGQDDEEFGLELIRGIARIYLSESKIDACIRTLEGALEKYTNQLSNDDVARLAHCYNKKLDFAKTIKLIAEKCDTSLMTDSGNEFDLTSLEKQTSDSRPPMKIVVNREEGLDTDNRCLLAVALISLGYCGETVEPLTKDLLCTADNLQHRSSLYDVAEAFFSQGANEKAKEILFKLTNQRDSGAASVWLLYSQCLKNLNEIEEAIASYRKFLSYKPDDYDSRLALSNLLSVQGRLDEALEVTRQPLFTDKPVDIPLLYQCCQLLERAQKWQDYCEAAKALLLTDMFYTQHPKEVMGMMTARSLRTRLENLRAIQRELNKDSNTHRQKSVGAKLDSNTMLKTFLRYLEVLYHVTRDYQELKRICFSAYTCAAFECFESSIDFYASVACVCTNDKDFTYNTLKLLATRNLDYNQVWNMLSVSMSNIYQDIRHGRFCMRLFIKNPDVIQLALFNGHNALMSGSYKHALGEYMNVFRKRPNDPFAAFCIAITFLSLSCQRYVSSKYLCLFQMIAFLNVYVELRGSCQEVMYNIGRFFHQMNMVDKAVIFYKQALAMDDRKRIKMCREDQSEFDEIFDLRREAAFNLALIYKNSQSYRLAYQVIKDNFTI